MRNSGGNTYQYSRTLCVGNVYLMNETFENNLTQCLHLPQLTCAGKLLATRELFKSYFLSIHHIREEFAYDKTNYNVEELEYLLNKSFLKFAY